MQCRMSFADVECDSHRVTTRKEGFLRQMDGLVPWAEWCGLMAPFWHPSRPGRRGRKAVPVERMLRVYCFNYRFRRHLKTARHEKGPRVLYCEKRKAARVVRRRAENPPAGNAVGSGSA